MTNSEDEPEVVSDLPTREDGSEYGSFQEMLTEGPVLGVLTGQYPARTMPIAMNPEDPDDDDGSA